MYSKRDKWWSNAGALYLALYEMYKMNKIYCRIGYYLIDSLLELSYFSATQQGWIQDFEKVGVGHCLKIPQKYLHYF